MASKSYEALMLFKEQLKRHVAIKVIVAPTSVNERGVVAKLSIIKNHPQSRRPSSASLVKLRLAVEGAAESQTGLDLAMTAIEAINAYLKRPIRLEDAEGNPIPNTRVTQSLSEDDSVLDSPDGTAVQDVLDERAVYLYLSE